ncbi:MAG: hypothetical protein ACQESE_04480 [Nanobdellota archaeon]
MKKVSVLLGLLLFVLIISQGALAVKEHEIVDGWYSYDAEFNKDGHNYSIRSFNLEQDGDDDSYKDGQIFIKRVGPQGEYKTGLSFGECELTNELEWCFVNASYDNENVDIDDKGKVQPGIKIRMVEFEYVNELDISRSFSTTSFNRYEEAEVTLTLKNEGDNPINDIRVEEPVPEGFELVKKEDSFNYYPVDRLLKANFNLYPGSSWSKTYTIKANEYVEAETLTSVTYDVVEASGLTQQSSKKTLKVTAPYRISHTEFKNSYSKDDQVTFKVTLENNEDEAMDVEELNIGLHPNLKVKSVEELDKEAVSKYGFSGTIPAGEKKVFIVEMRLPYSGSYEISYDTVFSVKDSEYSESGETTLDVIVKGLSCRFDFSEKNPLAGTTVNYTVLLENDDKETFYDINGSWTDLFTTTSFSETNIFSGDVLAIATESVVLPLTFERTSYSFLVNTEYRSDKNEWFTCTNEQTLVVEPVDRYLNVTTEFDPLNASRAESVTATVTVHNLLDTPIDKELSVAEMNYLNFSLEGQSEVTLAKLSSGQSKEVYAFTFTVPENISDNSLSLEREVSIPDFGYEEEFVSTLFIADPLEEGNSLEEKKEEIKNDFSEEKSSSSEDSGKKDPDDMNFMQKLVHLIKSFFN